MCSALTTRKVLIILALSTTLSEFVFIWSQWQVKMNNSNWNEHDIGTIMYNLDHCHNFIELIKVKLSQISVHKQSLCLKTGIWKQSNIRTIIVKTNRWFFEMSKRKWENRAAILCYAKSFCNLLFLSWFRRNRGTALKKKRLVFLPLKKIPFLLW